MFCRVQRFGLLLLLAMVNVICSSGLGSVLEAEIKPGDRIATVHDHTPVKKGKEVLLTLGKGEELVAKDVKGDWVAVTVEQDGKKISGWIYARHLVRSASPIDPKAAQICFGRGMNFLKDHHLDSAIAEFSEALRLNPQHVTAYLGRGLAYDQKGLFGRAVTDYTQAIRLNPKQAASYRMRGECYFKYGDTDNAIADANEAVRLDPNDWLAYADRGDAYEECGAIDKAVADYSRAIRLNPKSASLYYKRGAARLDAGGSLDQAVDDFTKVIELEPKNSRAYELRGIAYESKGNVERAKADYAKAEQLARSPG